jgi:hypothetical protein
MLNLHRIHILQIVHCISLHNFSRMARSSGEPLAASVLLRLFQEGRRHPSAVAFEFAQPPAILTSEIESNRNK